MKKNDFALGGMLKTLRSNKETTRSLAKKIGYSHSYISAVENGTKVSPSNEFIQKYLLEINNKNIDEANHFIRLINRLSEGLYDYDQIPSTNFELPEASEQLRIDNEKFENIHLFVSNRYGKKREVLFQEPINDISFHLSEIDNVKYFKGVELGYDEMEEIQNLITSYLKTVYMTKMSQTYFLYGEGKFDKEDLNYYCGIYKENLKKLDTELEKFNDLKELKEISEEYFRNI
ncbi:helix-turn-helix domain-containing protein [Staphylococcus hominis]|uniref:helix-turn-helix domain-containing protein n=1 Tax=Staphylococcus hominis TaxID=1290 RepID=UPI0034CE0E13